MMKIIVEDNHKKDEKKKDDNHYKAAIGLTWRWRTNIKNTKVDDSHNEDYCGGQSQRKWEDKIADNHHKDDINGE